MSLLVDRLMADLPPPTRSLVARLVEDVPRAPEDLLQELDAYVGFVSAYAASHPRVDAIAADALAKRCRRLIEQARGRDADQRQLVQAACLYLVAIEGDLDTMDGFDDDAHVISVVEDLLREPR